MRILVDHNLEGLARRLFSELRKEGWVETLELEFVYFTDVSLDIASNDATVWRFAQNARMIILTDNRNRKEEDALAAVIQRENTPSSLPVVTVGNSKRLVESEYRRRAVTRLADIIIYLDDNLGTGRLFIP